MSSKFEQQVNDLKLDKILFHYKYPITYCSLFRDDTVLARGAAICSQKDQFVKSVGRAKAFGRAVKAAYSENNSDFVRDEDGDTDCYMSELLQFFLDKDHCDAKSMYLPPPNAIEKKTLEMLQKAKQQIMHSSDCATHNEPAMENGKCDCCRGSLGLN